MNKTFLNRRWRGRVFLPLVLIALALALFQPSAEAKRHRYWLPDGVMVTIDVQPTRTLITLIGESKSAYRIDCSTDLLHWSTLQRNANLGRNGVYTLVDNRSLPRCFYKVTALRAHPSRPGRPL